MNTQTAMNTEPQPGAATPRQGWLADRRTGCGGSDAANILGAGHRTPYDVWMEKTGRREPDDLSGNDAVRIGNRFEALVAEEWAERNPGHAVTIAPPNIHLEGTPLLANPDRYIDSDGILECKTTVSAVLRARNWTAETAHVIQVLHYLAVTGRDYAVIYYLETDTRRFREFRIYRDKASIDAHIKAICEWWQTHIVEDIAPLMESDDLSAIEATDTIVAADAAVAEAVRQYDELRTLIDQLTEQKDAAEAAIKAFMNDAAVLSVGDRPAFTWKNVTSKRFDTTAFKKADPTTYEQFTKSSTSRTFRRVGYRKAKQ